MTDTKFSRRSARSVRVGNIFIGGDAPIAVQSMTNTGAHDFAATLAQVEALRDAGADIVRLAVPDIEAASAFTYLKEHGITLPLVADIHFDYRIALAAIEAGADKIRINPGNIGARDRVAAVTRACREKGLPIRIGVNSGSLEKEILARHGAPTPEALCESAYQRKLAFPSAVCETEADIVEKLSALNDNAYKTVGELEKAVCVATLKKEGCEMAMEYNRVIIPIMEKLRAYVDGMEKLTSAEYWPVPTYGELMFTV